MLTTNAGVTTTYFVGTHYEVSNGVVTKYYYAGSQRIAMRKNGTLTYILSDHLGSTSLVTDANGAVINQTKYKAWGETRYSSGAEQTKYTYTGQYSYTDDFGLMYYGARWFDPSLGRFAQADSIIPAGVQGWDRYSYTFNNPLRYVDPSGHVPVDCFGTSYCGLSNSDLMYDGNRNEQGRDMDSDTDNDGIPNVPDPDFNPITIGRSEEADCIPGNLVECYYGNGYMPEGDYEITLEEFLSLMKAISYDVPKQGTMTDYSFKGWYDTPFYDGGFVETNICVQEIGCFMGHELNYIAQGAASASVNEGLIPMYTLIVAWKVDQYFDLPTLDTLEAAGYGYVYYSHVFHDNPLSVNFFGNTEPFSNVVSSSCTYSRLC